MKTTRWVVTAMAVVVGLSAWRLAAGDGQAGSGTYVKPAATADSQPAKPTADKSKDTGGAKEYTKPSDSGGGGKPSSGGGDAKGGKEEPVAAIDMRPFGTASGRTVFWRGEQIVLSLAVPLAAPTEAVVSIQLDANGAAPAEVYRGKVSPVGPKGYLSLRLPSAALGDGNYLATAKLGQGFYAVPFTIRPSRPASPGMVIEDDEVQGLPPNAALAGVTGHMSFLTDNATGTRFRLDPAELNSIYDAHGNGQVLHWIHDATRPLSFKPPHSSPNTDGEYLRRMLLEEQVLMRYPAFAGQVFDYDFMGLTEGYVTMMTYWKWGDLAESLRKYFTGQEDALREKFRQETHLEPPTSREMLMLASAMGVPEGMGYIDQPSRRWAFQIVQHSGKMSPADLEALKKRTMAWCLYLMGVNRARYTAYMKELKALDPTLVHTTSNTLGHLEQRQGDDRASAYEPLDFRYVSVWDDQSGDPEYIYETMMATMLLNANRLPQQPLWLDTVVESTNGKHWQNTVNLLGHGAQGTGYSHEMNCSLAQRGRAMLQENLPANQESALSAKLLERFGALFAAVRYEPRVGLLLSNRQAVITPFNPNSQDRIYKMMYVLAHAQLQPCFVTEEMLEQGISGPLKALIVLGQTEDLSPKAVGNLRAFAAGGGKVLADTHTTVPWDFLQKSDAFDLPFREMGHPYNSGTAYNRQDATVEAMRNLVAGRWERVRLLLKDVVDGSVVDSREKDAALSVLRGGAGTFVTVTNDAMLDLSQLFTPDQQGLPSYQRLFIGYGEGTLGSWLPMITRLNLGGACRGGVVYDLIKGGLAARDASAPGDANAQAVLCDLTSLPGRLYAIYPRAVGEGTLKATQTINAGETIDFNYAAANADGQPLAAVVPVEIMLLDPNGGTVVRLYRATDDKGNLDEDVPTGVLGKAGAYTLQIRQLLDGRGVSLPVAVNRAPAPQAVAVAGPTVRDPQAVASLLGEKPAVAIPVFDAALKPMAESLAKSLAAKGVKAEVWDNPPVVEYALAYAPSDAEQAVNDKVDKGEAVGKVRMQNNRDVINNNTYATALTGYRCGRHLVLIGTAGQNPVLDGVRASGLLWADRSTEQPGAGLVQRLRWAMGQGADAVVVLGADPAGLAAAAQSLLNLPANDPVADGVRTVRSAMLTGHALPLTARHAPSARPLSSNQVAQLPAWQQDLRASLVPILGVKEFAGGLLVSLGRWGDCLALVDPAGKVKTIPAITSGQTACGRGVAISATTSIVFAWGPDGKLLWKAMGHFKGLDANTDTVIVESDKAYYAVAPDGTATPLASAPAEAAKPAAFVIEAIPLTEHFKGAIEHACIKDARTGAVIEGLDLTGSTNYKTKQFTPDQQVVTGPSGQALLVLHRYVGQKTAQVYAAKSHKVATVSIDTAYLTDGAISTDERTVALCGMEGTVVVMDLDGKPLAAAATGAFPRLFPLTSGGFAAAGADGILVVLDRAGKPAPQVDLAALATGDGSPQRTYDLVSQAKTLAWSNPPLADGNVPLDRFFWYLKDDQGQPRLINWKPAALIDFRWMDLAEAQVQFPQKRKYTFTIRAAAKYLNEELLTQPSWTEFLAMRAPLMKDERPAPAFQLWLDGKTVPSLSPQGGQLKKFDTSANKETRPWRVQADLKDDQITTFTCEVEVDAGVHTVGIEPVNVEDCFVKQLEIK